MDLFEVSLRAHAPHVEESDFARRPLQNTQVMEMKRPTVIPPQCPRLCSFGWGRPSVKLVFAFPFFLEWC